METKYKMDIITIRVDNTSGIDMVKFTLDDGRSREYPAVRPQLRFDFPGHLIGKMCKMEVYSDDTFVQSNFFMLRNRTIIIDYGRQYTILGDYNKYHFTWKANISWCKE